MSERNETGAEGEDWDGATWVNVNRYGHWEPSPAERTRALVLLGAVLGVLLLAAGFASIGAGGGGQAGTTSTSTTSTTEATTTTTTMLASSLAGEDPPEACTADDRDAQPLRDPAEAAVGVLNGVGVGGLASTVSGQLREQGMPAVPGDAPEPVAVTTIAHLPGFCAEAVRVAEALGIGGVPLATVEGALGEDPEAGPLRVEVVLGSDHFGG